MKRKRYVKLLMGKGISRNDATEGAKMVERYGPYEKLSNYTPSAFWGFGSKKTRKYLRVAIQRASEAMHGLARAIGKMEG